MTTKTKTKPKPTITEEDIKNHRGKLELVYIPAFGKKCLVRVIGDEYYFDEDYNDE